MKLDLSFEQNRKNIAVSFSENAGSIDANFGETTTVHDGTNGATFIPSVSAEGIISWTNDRDLPNPDPVNIKGDNGKDGKDGYTPIKGVDYFDGVNGKDGANGLDGHTPVKGTDYFTDADKAEMVQAVIATLPIYDGEVKTV